MQIISINQSQPKPIQMGKRVSKTGIFKEPLTGPIEIGELGIASDVQVNKTYHGGPDQALYVYSAADLSWWAEQLKRELPPGTMGENLTVSQFGEVAIGDRLIFQNGVILEVSAPRIPCATLAARFEMADFAKRFAAAQRAGFYLRVIQAGPLEAGMTFSWRANGGVPSLEIFQLMMDKKSDLNRVRAALKAPLAERYRKALEERLN